MVGNTIANRRQKFRFSDRNADALQHRPTKAHLGLHIIVLDMHTSITAEHTLHHQHRHAVSIGFCSFQNRMLADVLCFKAEVEHNFVQLSICQALPLTDTIGLFGNGRNILSRQCPAYRHKHLLCFAIGKHKGNGNRTEGLFQFLQCEELFHTLRLSLISIAHTVDTAVIPFDYQIVIIRDAVCSVVAFFRIAQHRTDALNTALQLYHAATIADDFTAACNATHKGFANHKALGAVGAHIAAATAHYTAHIIGTRTTDSTKIDAVFHQPHILPANDTAAIALHAADGPTVFTGIDHRSQLGADVQGTLPADLPVVFQIQIVFRCHCPCNAAYIGIAHYRATVGTSFHLATLVPIGIRIGYIRKCRTDGIGSIEGTTHNCDLLGNRRQILPQNGHGIFSRCADFVHCSRHRGNRFTQRILSRQNGVQIISAAGQQHFYRTFGGVGLFPQFPDFFGDCIGAVLCIACRLIGHARQGIQLSL